MLAGVLGLAQARSTPTYGQSGTLQRVNEQRPARANGCATRWAGSLSPQGPRRGERDGVRGSQSIRCDRVQYLFQNTVSVLKHIVIPESQHEVPHGFQGFGSVCIALSILGMLATIDLDDELRVGADKVDDESIDWDLPLELQASEPAITQTIP